MEINLNCDLGEKSIHYDGKNDNKIIKLINSANIACGYHAGNKDIMDITIKEAIKNNVSIGAHPGFNDLVNFGRKKKYISENELIDLIWKQLEIITKIAIKNNTSITHVKPHGALNNMACEDIKIALIIGQTIKRFNKDLIYLVLPLNKMEEAARKLDMKYACEIFADRNYDDNGQLISRINQKALVDDPNVSINNVLEMIESSSIKCLSGKKIKCNIDSICIHGDGLNSFPIVKKLNNTLTEKGISLTSLNKMTKFS